MRKSIVRYTTGRGANARVIRSSDVGHAVDELALAPVGEQLARVRAAERLGEHELGAEQPDAVDGQRGDPLGLVGHREVHVHERARAPPERLRRPASSRLTRAVARPRGLQQRETTSPS